jgi:glycosyltransferase involved in cell wall biosynthesis
VRIGIDGRYLQDHFPGIGRYTYNLVRHLSTLAVEDRLIVLIDPRARNTRYDLERMRAPNVTLVPAPVGVFSAQQQWHLPRLARVQRLDLYHSPHYMLPYALPCPSVVTIHDLIPYLYPDSLPNPMLRWPYAALVRAALWRASAILVDAEATRRDLLRIGAREAKIAVVPLAVDSTFGPRPASEIAAVLERYAIQPPYVLYVGINKPHKNLVRLIRAWAALPADVRRGHTLVLAGPQDARYPQARACVAELGLQAEVCFAGAVANEHLPALYSGALAFVFPSVYEGFGLPVLEAMACGAPVACSDRSSLPEIAADAALTFDPWRVEAIRDALQQLMTQPALRERLSMAGRARAQAFAWQETAARTLDVYRRLVAQR